MAKFTFQWQDSLLVFCSKNLFPCVFVWWETPMWPINICEKMGPEKWVWIIEKSGLSRSGLSSSNVLSNSKFVVFFFLPFYYNITAFSCILWNLIYREFFFLLIRWGWRGNFIKDDKFYTWSENWNFLPICWCTTSFWSSLVFWEHTHEW